MSADGVRGRCGLSGGGGSLSRSSEGSAIRIAVLIALTHATVDAYVAFLHPLLPRIMEKLGLSIALAATLVLALSLAASMLQPGFGYLADHYGRRFVVASGPILTGVFLSMIGLAPSFSILIALLVLGGLGAAAFHPPGASLSTRAAEGRGSGLRLSVFSFGGAAGYAAGPLIAVWLVARTGFEGMWVAMLPGLLLGAFLIVFLRDPETDRGERRPPTPKSVLRALRGPLGLLFGISAAGAFLQRLYLTMEPIIVARAGATEATGAAMLSIYLGAQALGTLTSGVLTDRINRQHLLVTVTILAMPAHILAVILTPAGIPSILAVVAAGFLNMALLPPIVVMAQEMVPEGTAVSSGIVMGLAWAAGTLGVPVVGLLADQIGPVAASAWAMPAILIGTVLALHPSLRRYRHAVIRGPIGPSATASPGGA